MGQQLRDMLSEALDRERALTTDQASKITGQAPITMAQQRARGDGPPFIRINRSIRYRLGDLLDWRDAHTVGRKVAP